MPAFIEEGRRLNEIGKVLIYLSIWQSLGAIYLVPDNGVVVSPGFDTESAVPSDSEIAIFVLVAVTVSPYIPKEKPRAC